MKIACIGWGSLVWDPRELPVRSGWFTDGPFLPVEFCRQSGDGRLTLVITPGKPELRTLWALMAVSNIEEALDSLQKREGIPDKNKEKYIGAWPSKRAKVACYSAIGKWAKRVGIDAAVWTALPPKFNNKDGVAPSEDEAVKYLLEGLSHEKRRHAEEYIRRAPLQIDTDFRRRFELEFGWKPIQK